MVQTLDYCLGNVAPYYNLVLVVIVILLFLRLFKMPNKKIYLKPWKFLFGAVLVYVGEEVLTIVEMSYSIILPGIIFPLIEMGIITLFIYALLLQKDNTKK